MTRHRHMHLGRMQVTAFLKKGFPSFFFILVLLLFTGCASKWVPPPNFVEFDTLPPETPKGYVEFVGSSVLGRGIDQTPARINRLEGKEEFLEARIDYPQRIRLAKKPGDYRFAVRIGTANEIVDVKIEKDRIVIVGVETNTVDKNKLSESQQARFAMASLFTIDVNDTGRALPFAADDQTYPAYLDALSDTSWAVQAHAADALGKIGNPLAVEPLIAILKDKKEKWMVRKEAAIALGGIGDRRAVVPLVDVLENHEDYFENHPKRRCSRDCLATTWSIVLALGELRDPRAVDAVFAYLERSDYPLEPAEALGKIGGPAVPLLIEKLASGDSPYAVTRALGLTNDPRSIAALETVLHHKFSHVRKYARIGIKRIKASQKE